MTLRRCLCPFSRAYLSRLVGSQKPLTSFYCALARLQLASFEGLHVRIGINSEITDDLASIWRQRANSHILGLGLSNAGHSGAH